MEEDIEVYRLSSNSVVCLTPNKFPKITIMEYIPDGDGLKHLMYKGIIEIIDDKIEFNSKLSYISYIPNSNLEDYKISELESYEILKYKKYD